MKHTLIALALSLGLVASGCAHGGASSRSSNHAIDGMGLLLLVGVVTLGVAAIVAAQTEGTPQCTDPLGRCGDYEPALPMR